MKKLTFLTLLSFACVVAACNDHKVQSEANRPIKTGGDLVIARTSAASVDVGGTARLDDVRVLGDCCVAGDAHLAMVTVGGKLRCKGACQAKTLQAHEVALAGASTLDSMTAAGDLEVRGDATITNSTVRGTTNVFGQLNATDCALAKVVVAVDKDLKITLTRSTADNMVVKNQTGFSAFGVQLGSPVNAIASVVLDGTTIQGDVEFKDVVGTVELRNNAQVRGNVLGGIIKR